MSEPMRALSIRQPYAWAIAGGFKPAENRTRKIPLKYIGVPVALHASKERDDVMVLPTLEATDALLQASLDTDPLLSLGAIVAVVTFTGCHPLYNICNPAGIPQTTCSPWSEWGSYHWLVGDVRPIAEPVPCRGALGFWPVPADVERAVREQLEPKSITGKGSGA
jgi:hypothetical protein